MRTRLPEPPLLDLGAWSLDLLWILVLGAWIFYLPSFIELGNPVSQPFGVFQGRSERFSDSEVTHPTRPIRAVRSTQRNIQEFWVERGFISRLGIGRDHLITFHDLSQLPAR